MDMIRLEKQTSMLYEIAMSIGNSTNLDVSLKESLTTLLRKLDGIGIGVFDERKMDMPIAQIPKRGQFISGEYLSEALQKKVKSESRKHLLLEKKLADEYLYFFNLSNTGVLFFRRRSSLDDVTLKVLDRLCDKLDQSIQACFATEELYRKERDLQNSLFELKKAQEDKDKFLATVAHEIRTPLNGVVGFIEQLADTDLDETQKHYLDVINHSSDSLMGIINDTLDFSKIDSGKLELDLHPTNLREVLEPAIEIFKCKASEKNILLTTEIDERLGQVVLCDSLRLKQIVSNLVTNAIKFTESGKVEVSIKLVSENESHIFVSFDVSDTGIGIASKSIDNIFNPFSQAERTTTRRFGGTGLGLAISYQLVQKLGGELTVQSVLNAGSVFRFEIQLTKTKTSLKRDVNHFEVADFAGKKILVAEDNLVNQMLVKAILKSIQVDFNIADNGAEACVEFEKGEFDLVLMDINMPVMDGLEALSKMREFEHQSNRSKTPIVALTANALIGDRERYKAHGMDDCLTKPLKKIDLFRIFEQQMKPAL
jgi:signal transduction histidine kinase/ActR/RegA family two-component response regulator